MAFTTVVVVLRFTILVVLRFTILVGLDVYHFGRLDVYHFYRLDVNHFGIVKKYENLHFHLQFSHSPPSNHTLKKLRKPKAKQRQATSRG